MTLLQLADLWERLDRAEVITGAWSGIEFLELPDEVREKFSKAVQSWVKEST